MHISSSRVITLAYTHTHADTTEKIPPLLCYHCTCANHITTTQSKCSVSKILHSYKAKHSILSQMQQMMINVLNGLEV